MLLTELQEQSIKDALAFYTALEIKDHEEAANILTQNPTGIATILAQLLKIMGDEHINNIEKLTGIRTHESTTEVLRNFLFTIELQGKRK